MPIYCGVLYGVSTLLIALRLWLRVLKQAGGLGLDDALLVAAWFGSSMFTTVIIISCSAYYTGRHAWDIPLANFESTALMAWLAQFASLATGALTKISVLCFYRRLVAGTYSRRWKWAVIAAIAFTAAWTLTFVFMLIFNCNPTRAYWKSFDPLWPVEYTCINTTVVNLLAGIFAVLSDLYAVALPCLMTRHFDLPRRQKVALNLIFSLGLLAVGASGVRTYYLWRTQLPSSLHSEQHRLHPPRSWPETRRKLDDLRRLHLGPTRAPTQHHLCITPCPTSLPTPLSHRPVLEPRFQRFRVESRSKPQPEVFTPQH